MLLLGAWQYLHTDFVLRFPTWPPAALSATVASVDSAPAPTCALGSAAEDQRERGALIRPGCYLQLATSVFPSASACASAFASACALKRLSLPPWWS